MFLFDIFSLKEALNNCLFLYPGEYLCENIVYVMFCFISEIIYLKYVVCYALLLKT